MSYTIPSDSRYSVTQEWTGHKKQQYVVRFCGNWLDSRKYRTDALVVALTLCKKAQPDFKGGQEKTSATDVFHKITLPNRKSRYSAWFKGDPINDPLAYVVGCERIDAAGRSYPCTQAEEDALVRSAWTARIHSKFGICAST